MSFILIASEEAAHTREMPEPYLIGAIAFVILLALLFWTLSFGKGRTYKE